MKLLIRIRENLTSGLRLSNKILPDRGVSAARSYLAFMRGRAACSAAYPFTTKKGPAHACIIFYAVNRSAFCSGFYHMAVVEYKHRRNYLTAVRITAIIRKPRKGIPICRENHGNNKERTEKYGTICGISKMLHLYACKEVAY